MSAFVLKLIALFSMLLDHTLKVLPAQTFLTDVFGMSLDSSFGCFVLSRPWGGWPFPFSPFSLPRAAAIPTAPGGMWAGSCCSG